MQHEKIFKRADGSKVTINVSATLDYHAKGINYMVSVYVCQPKKRIFKNVFSGDDFSYRRLNNADRAAFILAKQLEVVTEAEILEVKTELWQLLKPLTPL